MPYRLRLGGGNDYVALSSPTPRTSVNGYIETAFVVTDVSASFIRVGHAGAVTASGLERLIVETNGNRVLLRCNSPSDTSWTGVFASALTVGQRIVMRIQPEGSGVDKRLFVNGVDKGLATSPDGITDIGGFDKFGVNANVYSPVDIEYFSLVNNTTPTNSRYYDSDASGGTGLLWPETTGNGTAGNLTNIPDDGNQWFEYSNAVTPVTFTGTVPAQNLTTGDALSLGASTYFSGTETPFTYSSTGAALPAWATLNTTTGVISGTSELGTTSGVIITATDTATNTAVTNAFDIVVTDAQAVAPQGTVTIGAITVGETTASVPFTYDLADETGYDYRLDAGTPVVGVTSPISLTGLTANTAYSIEVRATNATGAGAWSTAANFTTDAAVATFVSEPLKDNVGNLLVSAALDYIAFYSVVDGSLVLRVTGVSTAADGRFTVQNAALSAGVQYRVDWQPTAQGVSRMPIGTAA